jgi:hypothetical protein
MCVCHLTACGLIARAQNQQFANIGDLKLQNGGVIRNCRIVRANVIDFPIVLRDPLSLVASIRSIRRLVKEVCS